MRQRKTAGPVIASMCAALVLSLAVTIRRPRRATVPAFIEAVRG